MAVNPEIAALGREAYEFFQRSSVSFEGDMVVIENTEMREWNRRRWVGDRATLTIRDCTVSSRVRRYGEDGSVQEDFWTDPVQPWDESLAPECTIGDEWELRRWQARERESCNYVSCLLRRYADCSGIAWELPN